MSITQYINLWTEPKAYLTEEMYSKFGVHGKYIHSELYILKVVYTGVLNFKMWELIRPFKYILGLQTLHLVPTVYPDCQCFSQCM